MSCLTYWACVSSDNAILLPQLRDNRGATRTFAQSLRHLPRGPIGCKGRWRSQKQSTLSSSNVQVSTYSGVVYGTLDGLIHGETAGLRAFTGYEKKRDRPSSYGTSVCKHRTFAEKTAHSPKPSTFTSMIADVPTRVEETSKSHLDKTRLGRAALALKAEARRIVPAELKNQVGRPMLIVDSRSQFRPSPESSPGKNSFFTVASGGDNIFVAHSSGLASTVRGRELICDKVRNVDEKKKANADEKGRYEARMAKKRI
ncbi:hypothetical protein B0H19DRAFT_1074074 [Mycena capillaripes]|nr:hypothetical protein B0H19DRAFT_1074074 [Mycena capillaripes]